MMNASESIFPKALQRQKIWVFEEILLRKCILFLLKLVSKLYTNKIYSLCCLIAQVKLKLITFKFFDIFNNKPTSEYNIKYKDKQIECAIIRYFRTYALLCLDKLLIFPVNTFINYIVLCTTLSQIGIIWLEKNVIVIHNTYKLTIFCTRIIRSDSRWPLFEFIKVTFQCTGYSNKLKTKVANHFCTQDGIGPCVHCPLEESQFSDTRWDVHWHQSPPYECSNPQWWSQSLEQLMDFFTKFMYFNVHCTVGKSASKIYGKTSSQIRIVLGTTLHKTV